MKQYSRYIIRSLLGPLILITITLTGIIWLTQSLRFVDLIINKGLSFGHFIYLSSLLIPSLLLIILPIALFATVIFTYNKLIIDSELIILRSAGLGRISLSAPAIIIASLITIASYALSLYILPASYRTFKDQQNFIRNNYAEVLLQEGIFNTPVKDLTIYINERLDNGLLKGILAHDNRNPEKPVTMMAQEGRFFNTSEGPRFDLLNGNRQEINHKTGQLSLLYFERYTLDISIYTNPEQKRWREPKERYLGELLTPEPSTPENLKSRLIVEAHQRLTWPLYNITLTLIALAALLPGQFNRRGQWIRITTATPIAISAIILGLGLTNLIANNQNLIPLLYINNGLFTFISLAILYGKPIKKPRKEKP